MDAAEFDEGCRKLREQWPKSLSEQRASMIYRKWSNIPKGVFSSAVEAILYHGGMAPSGETIDDAIATRLSLHNQRSGATPEKLHSACITCSESGIIQVKNSDGNYCAVACNCPLGKYRESTGQLANYQSAQNRGYTIFKTPLSHKAKKHPEWVDADTSKYSSKLIGVFNAVQRSMLMDDQRGLNGIRVVCKINNEDAFQIYELMLQKNTEHELIRKNNNDRKF